jgi:4-hydroxyacetophenone monooxygenase
VTSPAGTADAFTSSPFVDSLEPITETDAEIRAYLDEAEVPPLLPALAYVTGELDLLRPELRPDPLLFGAMPQGGLSEEQQAHARGLALDALARFRDRGCRPAEPPSDETLLRIMEHAVGSAGMDDYLPLLEEELAYRGEDRRAPGWRAADVAPGVDFRVAIIGAGMSGLLAGHRLQQAGIPFVVLEKNPDVGGTWLENTYPGCRVDNPNHNYSYAFAQRHDWPLHSPPRTCCSTTSGAAPMRSGSESTSASRPRWSQPSGPTAIAAGRCGSDSRTGRRTSSWPTRW